MMLSEAEEEILTFEETWSQTYPTKSEGIRDTFGVTPTIYHIRLNRLLDNPAAIYAHPVTVARLRRLRESRRFERR